MRDDIGRCPREDPKMPRLPACLSTVSLSVCLPVYLSVCHPIFLPAWVPINLPVYLSVCLSICLPTCQSVYLPACLSSQPCRLQWDGAAAAAAASRELRLLRNSGPVPASERNSSKQTLAPMQPVSSRQRTTHPDHTAPAGDSHASNTDKLSPGEGTGLGWGKAPPQP